MHIRGAQAELAGAWGEDEAIGAVDLLQLGRDLARPIGRVVVDDDQLERAALDFFKALEDQPGDDR